MRESEPRMQTWGLDELLTRHTGLRIEPSPSEDVIIKGALSFRLIGPNEVVIEDEYDVEIHVPMDFPIGVPTTYETGQRIPDDYHKLEGNALCLGAPTALRIRLQKSPTLLTIVDEFLIPYLAGYTHLAQTGMVLFGELPHGSEGIRQYLRELFKCSRAAHPEDFARLASLKKELANKFPCPCGSGRRLGKCHNRAVNEVRKNYGRKWFIGEYSRLTDQLPFTPSIVKRVRKRKKSRSRKQRDQPWHR